MIKFLIGLFIGNLTGTTLMCILQISRDRKE